MPQRYAAVDVRGLDKTFHIPRHHVTTLKERALHPFRRIEVEELHALRELSFQVLQGEFFGIAGRNGSGKSTLLKCLAGIYRADRGEIAIAGRLAPFIELGVGFSPNLAALDNVVINGVMMGLTPREARARFDEIIAFAELEEFLDLPLKNYSSGMQVRLAFSVMVQADADVLLIDEVLAVGDANFQRKCFDVFKRLHAEGKTIVLVTHDMATIERFADRALLLDHGDAIELGDPIAVGRRYYELNFGADVSDEPLRDTAAGAVIDKVWVADSSGEPVDAVAAGEPFEVNVLVDVYERIETPAIHVSLANDDGVHVFGATSEDGPGGGEPLEAGERVHLRITVENRLGSARYFIDCSVRSGAGDENILTYRSRARDFTVTGADGHGLVRLGHEVELERGVPSERGVEVRG